MLSVRGVSKRFELEGVEVLQDVHFELPQGETLSLRGASGCGKTTLLNIVGGLEEPSQGAVLWNGVPLPRLGSTALSRLRGRSLGFIFQSHMLMQELNLFENCLLPARIQGKLTSELRIRVEGLLDRVGLKERKQALVAQLSGGERQRGALVRALSLQPKLVLADEPTGNLDEHTAEGVMQLLLSLCQETQAALLLVTHNTQFAQRTQRQAQLSLGRWTEH